MAKGKARELNKEERRITGSRPEHARTPLPLSTNGVITKVSITCCGAQDHRIKAVAPGTGAAMLQVDFQSVSMQFVSAKQVQFVLGLFGIARQARMGMAEVHRMPGITAGAQPGVQTTMTWTRNPMGSASREQFAHPVTGKVWPFVTLTIPPLSFSLLDTTAIDSMVDAMRKAHKLAIATFEDGPRFSRNPLAPSWRPPAEQSYRITGTGWLGNGPLPDNDRI